MVRTNPAGHFGAGLGGGEFVTTRSRHLSDWRLGQYCPNVSSSSSVLGEAFLLEFRHRNGWPTSFMPMPSFFNSAYMTCALVVPGGWGAARGVRERFTCSEVQSSWSTRYRSVLKYSTGRYLYTFVPDFNTSLPGKKLPGPGSTGSDKSLFHRASETPF